VTIVGALALPAAVAASSNGDVDLLQVLAGPLARAEHGKLHVLVPARLAAGFPSAHLYASGGLSGDGYDIQLGAAPHCADSPACFVAEFAAAAKGNLDGADRVSLTKGISARFSPIACGASCSPASIRWREYGALYTLWFSGTKSQLVALADGAISAGPR
jgi:hypothetical protein